MSRLVAIIFVALVGVCTVQGRSDPDWGQYLQANTQATGYAFTKHGVSVVKTTASASAAFHVQQAVSEVFAEAVSTIYSGHSAKAASFAAAKAIGTVLAEVYVQNSAQAHVKGKGVASGSAHADAHAYAETASRAIANAFSAATNFKFEAEASSLAIALNKALAKAYATLGTSVKVGPGGHVESYHAIYVKAFAEAVSHSIAIALAKVEADYRSGGSHSTSHASASSYVNDRSFKTHTGSVFQSGNSHVIVHGGGDHIVHQYQNW